MVEYTAANYVLFGATALVFSFMFIGCVILVAKEKRRWNEKKRERRRQLYHDDRMQQPREEPEAPSTMVSPTPSVIVSLRGINEWHLLPPIRENFRGYSGDSSSMSYGNSTA